MRRIRPAALERAGYQCEKCDVRLVLDVHHRDGDPTNNRAENLVALCHECHAAEHQKTKGLK